MIICIVYYVYDMCLVCVWYVYNIRKYTNMCTYMYIICICLSTMNMCVVYYTEDMCLVCICYVYNYLYNIRQYANICT